MSEPDCWCEHVDIGVGMQKVAENPDCPVCVEQPQPITKVILSGDTHGDSDHVAWLVWQADKLGADAVFVLGDFGIWSHLDDGAFVNAVSSVSMEHQVPVFFLPGNHENYDLLEQYERDNKRTEDGFVLIAPGVLYSPRGHRWTWGGVRFLSLGGAYSVDVQPRVFQDWGIQRQAEARREQGRPLTNRERYVLQTGHLSWWPQEQITETERDRAKDGGEVDIMLTHDKPLKSNPDWNRKDIPACRPNQEKIQDVVDAVKPKLLVHGHLHYAYRDEITTEGTKTFVVGLDCDPEASRYSGGSGDKKLSYAILDLSNDRPASPEPGADKDFFSLKWFEADDQEWNRDFVRQEA